MQLLPLVVTLATDPVPADNDVKAGWTAFAVFLLLALGVFLLWMSMRRQLKKAEKARQEGVYGDEPAAPEEHTEHEPEDHPTP